jgi:nicotinate-nucleotide adenylyltransferase
MPVHTPPHKQGGQGGHDPGPLHRLRMCELLLDGAADADGLSVCALEIERGGPSYTVDTLTAIHASHPEAQLTLILGADTASTLSSWREPGKLLAQADLAIAARVGSERQQVLDSIALARDGGAAGQSRSGMLSFLEMPEIEISSSQARLRAASGEPLADLLGADVARYIEQHRLYRYRSEAQRGSDVQPRGCEPQRGSEAHS